ncbi:hypothetical protein HDE_03582 [Halotydeus destructor]|nr:hypothetical protein HDE_03582 [Halotydeus destructor]
MVILKSTAIRKLLVDLARLLTSKEMARTRKYSILSIFFYVSTLLTAIASGHLYSKGGKSWPSAPWLGSERRWYDQLMSLANASAPSFYDHQWPLVGFSVYCFALSFWSSANTMLIERAILQGPLKDDSCLSLIQEKRYLNDLKNDINQNLRFIPLFVMSSLFYRSTGVIQLLMKRGEGLKDVSNLLIAALYLIHVLLVLLAIAIVCAQRQRERQNRKQLFIKWWKHSIPIQNAELKNTFKEVFSEEIPTTAILFDFDEKLVLGYLASLITFTIMFTQLSNPQLESKLICTLVG